MTFTQGLEVTSASQAWQGLAGEQQGSLDSSSTAFDCRAARVFVGVVVAVLLHSVLDIREQTATEDVLYGTETHRAAQPWKFPQASAADGARLLILCAHCQALVHPRKG